MLTLGYGTVPSNLLPNWLVLEGLSQRFVFTELWVQSRLCPTVSAALKEGTGGGGMLYNELWSTQESDLSDR